MDPDLKTEAMEDRVYCKVHPLEGSRQTVAPTFVCMGVLMVAKEPEETT